jgi:Protein of unknown function (DUF3060)
MKNRSVLFRLVLAAAMLAPLMIGHNAGADPADKVEVMTSDQKVNYKGEGRHFEITGNNDEITISGDSSRVEVVGHDNKISLDAVGIIEVVGRNNLITYRQGLNGPHPKIDTAGDNNKVVAAKQ